MARNGVYRRDLTSVISKAYDGFNAIPEDENVSRWRKFQTASKRLRENLILLLQRKNTPMHCQLSPGSKVVALYQSLYSQLVFRLPSIIIQFYT